MLIILYDILIIFLDDCCCVNYDIFHLNDLLLKFMIILDMSLLVLLEEFDLIYEFLICGF